MIIQLPDYQFGYHIVSLAKSERTFSNLKEEHLSTIFLTGEGLYLWPENVLLCTDPAILHKFSCCDEYDVFEIDSSGKAYLYYNNESIDNAFFLTGRCNSNCIMCPASEQVRKKASYADINHLLELINHIPSDAVHLTITGGEPFLLGRDIFRFLEALRNKFRRTNFLLLTNGRIFCVPQYCERLYQTLPPQTVLGIPIHGYNADTHDAVTQAPGSFVQTMAGLKNLLSYGFRIELRIVVSRITAPYLENMAALITEQLSQVESVKVIGLEMLGNAAIHQKKVWISYPEAFRSAKNAILKLISAEIDVALYNFPLCAVDREFWPICACSITDYKIRYAPACETCDVRDACGGIFTGTYRLAAKDIMPIGDRNA